MICIFLLYLYCIFYYDVRVERIFKYFIALCCAVYATVAGAVVQKPAMYVDPNAYAYMYPYLNNQMRTALNPGTTVSMVNNPIDVVIKTKPIGEQRRVVPRPRQTTGTARAAANTTVARGTNSTPTTARRVVARPNSTVARAGVAQRGVAARTSNGRSDPNTTVQSAGRTTTIVNEGVSTSRCLADYIKCMDGYCTRENTAYNRCYCSAKLAQIDSKYQPTISDMIIQIIKLQGGGNWTEEEMNEYWMEKIGNYVGENSWTNLDNALNIEWPTADERIRGQNAFRTGHEYCVQHLRACAYMASNMRDAYRSQISRDCTTYENALIRIKNAAESLIDYYSE
ncbi:MAG: hypothetical protein J6T57_01115 [Alphaproteobacteria bacterium]|nr:hypothetical protein [Alphaproteobacteria bacterium]